MSYKAQKRDIPQNRSIAMNLNLAAKTQGKRSWAAGNGSFVLALYVLALGFCLARLQMGENCVGVVHVVLFGNIRCLRLKAGGACFHLQKIWNVSEGKKKKKQLRLSRRNCAQGDCSMSVT